MYKMNYLKNTLRIVAFLFVGTLYAQQQANYSLYNYTMNAINPAYAGADGKTAFTMNLRSQWVNVESAPETQTFFFATPINENIGIGLNVVSDQVFIESTTSVMVDFSYRLQMNETLELFLGLKAGGSTYNLDTNALQYIGLPNDPILGQVDTSFRPNVGFGVFLKGEKYFVSLGAPMLISNERLDEQDGVVTQATEEPHLYLSGGYNFGLSQSVEFRPSVMLRQVSQAPIGVDITAAFRMHQRYEIGVMYRTEGAVAGVMMLNLAEWMDLGYAYEAATSSDLSSVNDGTHEVFLRFIFSDKKKNMSEDDMMMDE
jgi:type IX secretion system PorP/SprF family membrane protein